MDDLGKTVGDTVDGIALYIMSIVPGFEIEDLGDGTGVIKAVGNLTEAYMALYNRMELTAETTTADLNSVMVKALENND